jgi:uncharacterized hydrophobic protein (TIGR00271 family)
LATSMKKLEVYADPASCEKVAKTLDALKLYWYMEEVSLRGEKTVCKTTAYAPISMVEEIVGAVADALDLRKIENAIVVSDVESGMGAPYRITGRRFLARFPSITGRPSFMILEEAEEKARVSDIHLALAAIASLVALTGLVLNNPYIIIGAMLLSPILGPIYAFSILSSWGRPRSALIALAALITLIFSALVSPFLATLMAVLSGHSPPITSEIRARAVIGWESLVLPVLLGVASILAVSSSTWEALTGVAIAAALIPPAAVLALSLAIGDTGLASGATMNLVLNVLGLLAGGVAASIVLKAWRYTGRRKPR